MEDAMMDNVVERAKKRGIEKIKGYYYKTAKNTMVSEFFAGFGFDKISQQENGDSVWELNIMNYRSKKQRYKSGELTMTRDEVLKQAQDVFRDVFDDDSIDNSR